MSAAQITRPIAAMPTTRRPRLAAGVFAVLATLLASSCGSDGGNEASADAPDESAVDVESTESTVAEGTDEAEALTTVTLALDWLPDPSHVGLAVADTKGYFAEEGIALDVLPYGETNPGLLVGSGQADIGITWGAVSTISLVAQDQPLTAIYGLYQHNPSKLAVLESSEITRPADLAGGVWGGFGDPVVQQMVNEMVANDGGDGSVDEVVLQVGAKDAVVAGQIDAFVGYTSDILDVELEGYPLRTFPMTDFGLPDFYGNLYVANDDYLADNRDVVAGFVSALQRGYQEAIDNTAESEQILVDYFPAELTLEFVVPVVEAYVVDMFPNVDGGPLGGQSLERWDAAAAWLFERDFLVDPNGDPLTEQPDVASMFTNEFVEGT